MAYSHKNRNTQSRKKDKKSCRVESNSNHKEERDNLPRNGKTTCTSSSRVKKRILQDHSKCKAACETREKNNMVMADDKIIAASKINHETFMRGVVMSIVFDLFVDDLCSADNMGLNYRNCAVWVRIIKQNPDIACGVYVASNDLDVGTGDQGNMLAYTTDETQDTVLMTLLLTNHVARKLTDVRKQSEVMARFLARREFIEIGHRKAKTEVARMTRKTSKRRHQAPSLHSISLEVIMNRDAPLALRLD